MFDASATQRTDSQFNGPSVLREASASSSAALPSAAAMQAAISGATTLESMLNSTPEGQLMFRTVTVVAAGDQEKYEEIFQEV